MTFVGEIGLPRHEYLYDLRHIDLLLIRRGYERRQRHLWSATRWQTFDLMAAQVGSDGMKRAGIHGPADLIRFPWENADAAETTVGNMPSKAEIEELRRMMQEENDRNAASK